MATVTKQEKAKALINEKKSLGELLVETAVETRRKKEPLEVFGKKCYLLYPTVKNIYSFMALDEKDSMEEKLKGQLYLLQEMLIYPDGEKVISVGDIDTLAQSRSAVILKLIEYMTVIMTAFLTYQLEEPEYEIEATGDSSSVLKNYQALLSSSIK